MPYSQLHAPQLASHTNAHTYIQFLFLSLTHSLSIEHSHTQTQTPCEARFTTFLPNWAFEKNVSKIKVMLLWSQRKSVCCGKNNITILRMLIDSGVGYLATQRQEPAAHPAHEGKHSAGTACSHNMASYIERKRRKCVWENQRLSSQHARWILSAYTPASVECLKCRRFFTHDDYFSFLYYQISILTLYWTLADSGTSPGMSHPCTCHLELSSVKCPAATMNKSPHTPRVSLSCYSPREVKYPQYLGSYSDSLWKHPVQDVLEVNVISCSCWISIAGRGHIFTQGAKVPCPLPDMVKTSQVYKNAV